METSETNLNIIADYYKTHHEEILGFVAKRLQYTEFAEDIVQDIFVRLLRSDKMITPVTLPCLVYTIARNLIYDFWRHRKFVEEYEHYIQKRTASNDADALSVYGAAEITEILERGIARLNDKQRVIYRMNVYEGKQVSEISEALQQNYKSVENRLGTARKEIRRYMKRMLA